MRPEKFVETLYVKECLQGVWFRQDYPPCNCCVYWGAESLRDIYPMDTSDETRRTCEEKIPTTFEEDLHIYLSSLYERFRARRSAG